jgi:hypothetical protein
MNPPYNEYILILNLKKNINKKTNHPIILSFQHEEKGWW